MTPNQTLNRRRDPHRSDSWLIYLSDIHVGTIARAVGTPNATTQWKWHVGFYPGSNPGEQCWGTTATFEDARAHFEKAWLVFSSNRTEADYQAWREQRDWPRGSMRYGTEANRLHRLALLTRNMDNHNGHHVVHQSTIPRS